MARYLISTTETYRVDTEAEAQVLIQTEKSAPYGELIKYSSIYKERKLKGEVIDAWYKVTLTKLFDEEKEPIGGTEVSYKRESAFDEH